MDSRISTRSTRMTSSKSESSIRFLSHGDSTEAAQNVPVEAETAPLLSEVLNESTACPVCYIDLQPPVHQCSNGHLVCNECLSKVVSCPICRERLPAKPIRNLFMENLMEILRIKCSKQDCNKLFRTKQLMEEHAALCVPVAEQVQGNSTTVRSFLGQYTAHEEERTSDIRERIARRRRIRSFELNRRSPFLTQQGAPIGGHSLLNCYRLNWFRANQKLTELENNFGVHRLQSNYRKRLRISLARNSVIRAKARLELYLREQQRNGVTASLSEAVETEEYIEPLHLSISGAGIGLTPVAEVELIPRSSFFDSN